MTTELKQSSHCDTLYDLAIGELGLCGSVSGFNARVPQR